MRHGLSLWNAENRFTGWTDIDLSEQGQAEARTAGKLLRESGLKFDLAYTSVLKRAIRTLWIALEEMDCMWLPVIKDWRLNERHYGALQGLNKDDMAKQYGEKQVHIWRRSYATPPHSLTPDDPRVIKRENAYASLKPEQIPLAESLADTVERVQPVWNEVFMPKLREGQQILVAAHGNSLRALVKIIDNISDEDIIELNIPTGEPLVYEFDNDINPVRSYYLKNR